MTRTSLHLSMLAAMCLVAAPAGAQPPMPKPGPEHAVLKEDVGTWDASVEIMGPDGKPMGASKGTEVNTMSCNGMCLSTEFTGEIMGAPFAGHGVTAYDVTKKKYVGGWSDSMAPGMATSEAVWDAAKKTMTGTMDAVDMSGNRSKSKSVVQYTADGRRLFSMFMMAPDGKEMLTMRITYTRRK